MIPIDKNVHCVVGSKFSRMAFHSIRPKFDWLNGPDIVHQIERFFSFKYEKHHPEDAFLLADGFDNTYPQHIVEIMNNIFSKCVGKQTLVIHSYNPVVIGQFIDPKNVWVVQSGEFVTIDTIISAEDLHRYSIGALCMAHGTLSGINDEDQ